MLPQKYGHKHKSLKNKKQIIITIQSSHQVNNIVLNTCKDSKEGKVF